MIHKLLKILVSIFILSVFALPLNAARADLDLSQVSPQALNGQPFTWLPVVRNGFGNPAVKQIFALEAFKGQLYAVASSDGIPISFYRSDDGMNWNKLDQFGKDGGPIPSNLDIGVNVLHYAEPYLYAGTSYRTYYGTVTVHSKLWRTSDGTTWELVESNGFNSNNGITVLYTASNNDLYLSTYNKIMKSTTGNPGSWAEVYSPVGQGIWSMIEYKGSMYAGGEKSKDSIGSVKIFSNAGGTWTVSGELTSGRSTPNTEIGGFAIYNDVLYVGVKNAAGGEIWKLSNNTWTKVNTIVNGKTYSFGFGDPNNEKAEGFIVFDNQLFVVMNNKVTGMQIWATADGVTWRRVLDARGSTPLNIYTHWNNALVEYKGKLFLGTQVKSTTSGGEIWAYSNWPAVYLPLIRR